MIDALAFIFFVVLAAWAIIGGIRDMAISDRLDTTDHGEIDTLNREDEHKF